MLNLEITIDLETSLLTWKHPYQLGIIAFKFENSLLTWKPAIISNLIIVFPTKLHFEIMFRSYVSKFSIYIHKSNLRLDFEMKISIIELCKNRTQSRLELTLELKQLLTLGNSKTRQFSDQTVKISV